MRRETYEDTFEVATKAAEHAIATLASAISERGRASWVVAGGSSPMAAYKVLANRYAEALDWSKVTVVMGDERCVPLDHEDSNWGSIAKILFTNERISRATQLVPPAHLGAEEGARLYSQQVGEYLRDEGGELRIDLLWLGVGEDGHTLSLFPNNPALTDTSNLIIPVHNSPKPPADRISVSFSTAIKATNVVIFATGSSKREVLARVAETPEAFPVGIVAKEAAVAGSAVLWLYDKPAIIKEDI